MPKSRAIQTMPLVDWVDSQAAKEHLESAKRDYSKAQWKYYAAPIGKKKAGLKAFQEAANNLLRAELEYDKRMRKLNGAQNA